MALIAFQDNESTVKIIRSGYSPALRTLKRTHGISISRLNEVYHHDDSITMVNCSSEKMAADGLTKAVKDSVTWEADIKMMGMQWRSEQELSGKTDETPDSVLTIPKSCAEAMRRPQRGVWNFLHPNVQNQIQFGYDQRPYQQSCDSFRFRGCCGSNLSARVIQDACSGIIKITRHTAS